MRSRRCSTLVPVRTRGLVLAGHRYLSKMLAGVDLPPDERYVFYRSYYTDEQLTQLYSPS